MLPETHRYTETALEIQTMKLERLLSEAQKKWEAEKHNITMEKTRYFFKETKRRKSLEQFWNVPEGLTANC